MAAVPSHIFLRKLIKWAPTAHRPPFFNEGEIVSNLPYLSAIRCYN